MRLEDVPELLQQIQSRLPVKAAARTSILSKSWLHAWSTNPNLRFHVPKDQERKHLKLAYINRTLMRYLRDNIPIETFHLDIQIVDRDFAPLAEEWIRFMATKTCLKEISLTIRIRGASFNLPNEILSCENITKMEVVASCAMKDAIINCVSLRELHLTGVRISQQLLDHILSSCTLLAKIVLKRCSRDLKTIKVKSLPCLDELEILTNSGGRTVVEINDVPNLRLVSCNLNVGHQFRRCLPFDAHSISLGSRVTRLSLGGPGLVTDDASLDMIKTGFSFLEILTLDMTCWTSRSFHFTCASIKTFSLESCPNNLIDVQVKALKLRFFGLAGYTMPSLSFPISTTLEEITLNLRPKKPFGASFFLEMRKALELSSMCYVHITPCWRLGGPLDMDLDDLKSRLQFPPATNVQELRFRTNGDECLWENSPFFDAFFEICHPKHVIAKSDVAFKFNNHFCKLMMREVLEKKMTSMATWPRYLKHVQIRRRRQKEWETLSDSHTSFLDGPAPAYAEFKLQWY